MKVKVILNKVESLGVTAACLGTGLSYGLTDFNSICGYDLAPETVERLVSVLEKLAGKGEGHDKFLRVIPMYLAIQAPLYWWKQFDTYQVGTVRLSESTMHTLMKTPITAEMFEYPELMEANVLADLEAHRKPDYFNALNALLPQAFLQTRLVFTNYAAVQNMIKQRMNHKLTEWHTFCKEVRSQCLFPHLLWPKRFHEKKRNIKE